MKCPECRTDLPDDANFCLKCGHKIDPKSHLPDSPHPKGERKRVTALFSDLAGYTAITERLDPEEVKEIMGQIFAGTRKIINKYEGFIEKFVGDGVLAFFGVPKAHEDDPIRAIQAAWDIHAFVDTLSPRYQKKIGRGLSMHSGINTGLVVTADVDPEKGTHGVTGDAINVAARLSDLAVDGEIVVGPGTHRASQDHFTFETLEPIQVKGKTDLIPIFRLLSIKTPNSIPESGRQISSMMVGRDQGLAQLELQVLKATNGQGSVINVIGEPGIGKSRLIAELRKREVMQRVTLLEGRAISIGKNLSFHPIIDLLKQWAEITYDDPENRALDKLEKAVKEVNPGETDETLPFLATMMGMKLTGKYADRIRDIKDEALERLIFKNVRDLLIKGSELRPIVLIMEDLHWADTSSMDLLDTLYRLIEKHKIVFINVFRPGYLEPWNNKITAMGQKYPAQYTEIELRPLEKDSCEQLIGNMLRIKGLPHGIRGQIVDRAGGNPFFIEEVVRSLIDEGAVVRGKTNFMVTEKIYTMVIPSTINDVLMARIDRLEEQTKDLIKVASVIGRSFFVRILKDIATSINNVDERLTYLKDIQLLRDRTRMQEIEYLFNHALTQETAYESILLQKRSALHLKVANSIEKIFESRLHEFYGMLAFHYGKGDVPEKVEEYMAKAGEEALRSSASSEALHYFKEAVKLYVNRYGDNADPEKLISFKIKLAQAHLNRGDFLEALSYLDDILQRRGYKFPQGKWISGVKGLWDFFCVITLLYFPIKPRTRIPEAREVEDCDLHFRKGLSAVHVNSRRFLLESLPIVRMFLAWDLRGIPQSLEWVLISCTGFNVAGFSSIAVKMLERAKHISDTTESNALDLAVAEITLAVNMGSWGSVPDLDESMVNTALGKGDLYKLTAYLLHLGCIKLECGNIQQAELCAEKLHFITESYGYDFARVHYHFVKTNILIRKRALHEALIEADKGVTIADQANMRPPMLRSLGVKIIVEVLFSRPEKAALSVKKGETLLAELGIVGHLYRAPFMLGRLLTHLEQLTEALMSGNRSRIRQCKREARVSAKQAGRVSKKHALYRTWILKSIGEYYWLIDDQGKALQWWNNAISEGERLGSRLELSHTYFDVGKRLLEPRNKTQKVKGLEAEHYLEKAQKLFEEIGLEWGIDNFEKLKADRSLLMP